MKTYTVKEIAEMLNTNPETVRRWIRLGKLKAAQQSRKGGNIVTEQSLNEFLKSTSKYSGVVAGTVGMLGLASLLVGLPTAAVLGSIFTQKKLSEALNYSQIPVSEVKAFIENSIQNAKTTLWRKEEEMKDIQREIADTKKMINDLENLLIELHSKESTIASQPVKGEKNDGMESK